MLWRTLALICPAPLWAARQRPMPWVSAAVPSGALRTVAHGAQATAFALFYPRAGVLEPEQLFALMAELLAQTRDAHVELDGAMRSGAVCRPAAQMAPRRRPGRAVLLRGARGDGRGGRVGAGRSRGLGGVR